MNLNEDEIDAVMRRNQVLESELIALRTKVAEVVAELTARSEAAYAKQTAYDGGYHHAVSNAYESSADLVAEKLGVK